ncbi:MAG: hypothetical protein JXR37_01815, partial [Kiritimatiellae bacterium]|nr:hypothetical protein [Kiritimatiellia bacterium]
HVVATYSNGAAAELWLDGASQGTASFAGWNGTVSGLNVYLGKTAAGEGKDYQGLLDEVRVYNRVLAGAEVTALGSLGLVSYWSFDDPNEPGRDEVGVNDGTVYGATWTNAGISGGAMWFDGVNDYINVGHDSSLDITQDLTIAAWALKKHKTFGDMLQVMVAKEDKPDDTGRSYQLTWIDGEPNTPCFAYGLGSGQACHGLWAVGYPSWEQWHHVVLTHQTGVGNRMYIDGILNAQDSEGSALPSNPGTDTRIGESQSWEPWFYYGMLDEVRIYNRALSSNEVAALFGETVTDADADGLPDNWEQQIVNASAGAYTSVWQVLPGADFDDDWATNLKEYEAGTDPTQRGSSPYPGGLVSYWSFDDEGQPGRDDAGENDLTVNGATWTGSGRSGGALSLDGDDYAVASSYPGTWSQHSVSLWMKSSELDAGTNSALFGRHDGTWAAGGLNVELRFAGAEAGEAAFEGYGAESVSTATALNDGQWHHVVATYSNGAAAELWLDGASQGTVSFAGWNGTVANLNVYLGKAAVGEGKDYEGLLDEVRVYNRVLSAAEIGAMRNLGLVSYWSFDDPNEPGRDEAGVNHGAVYGATWANAGIRGGALWFDGVNDYINVGHDSSLNITQDLTISAWARKRLKTFGDPLQVVVAKENKPDDTGRSYQLTWIDGEPNTPCFAYGVGPGQPCHGLWALGYPSWEQWHHVVLTHETGVGNRMYIDGVLNAQDSEGSPLRSNPDTDTRIGDSQSSEAWFYYGLLDEVRIYNRALSSNEVAALFGESVTDADGDGLSDSWEQQIVDASGGAYTSVWQVLPGADFDDDWATNQKEYQAGTDPVVRESSAYPDGLVSYWSFDDEGQPGRDDAGEHDLTVNGATWTGAGRSGGALSLDGDDYAVASSYPGTWSQHSVSLWMKSSEPDAGTNSALFGRHDGTWAAGGLNMELRFAGAEAGEAAFEGYGAESVSTVTALNDGQWHHLVATYSNGAAAELWLDGVSQGTAAFAGWNGTVSGLNVYLGKTAAGEGKDYEGLLDEVRIYNRVLSAAEIGALWDFGLVSYWSFDDPNEPGRDEVGVNDGTLCGATWTNAGIRGGAMWFDGVNDYINAGHDSSLNITQDLTIAAWAWKKHKTFGDLLQVMVAKEVKPDDTGRSYQLTWIDGEPDTPCFAYGVGSGQPCHGLWAVGYPSWEQWHHVVLTHETGVGNRMYIDGVLNAQDSEGSALRSNPGTDTRIGDSQSSEPWFYYGMLDEVRIYSRALSSNEVAGLFGASVTDADGDGLPDSWEERIVAASGGAYTSVWQVLPGADFDDDWATNQKEYESGTDPVLRESSPYPGGLVSYWSFDDEGQPGRDDAREHDLTVNGATWTGAGRSGGALSLDGDDYAVASSYPGTWSQHSVSLWMKSSEPDAGTNSALFGRH